MLGIVHPLACLALDSSNSRGFLDWEVDFGSYWWRQRPDDLVQPIVDTVAVDWIPNIVLLRESRRTMTKKRQEENKLGHFLSPKRTKFERIQR
jgi:hypothetical protein